MFLFFSFNNLSFSQDIYLNVKIYLDDPALLPNAHVPQITAEGFVNDLDDILAEHNIRINPCYELLPNVDFFNNPNNFFTNWPYCNDAERISVYIRKGGFGGIAGESRGIGRIWTQNDLATLTHEFGHVLGLQHTNFGGVNACASSNIQSDGIDDTPFHPQLFTTNAQGELEGIAGYFTGCSVNWEDVVDPCGVPVIDQSDPVGNPVAEQIEHYINNLENNSMAQIYHPLQTTCTEKDFTLGQGERMHDWVQSRLRRFIASGPQTCEVSNWTFVNDDIINDVDFTGVVIIENPISVSANVTFSNGLIILREGASLTFESGSNISLNDMIVENYRICDFEGNIAFTIESGCQFDINLVQFRNFNQNGITINSPNGFLNQVLFMDSQVYISGLNNLGPTNDGLWLTDVLCNFADITISDSRVAFHGGEFRFSDIIANQSELFTQTSGTPRRTTFYSGSKIIYNSGGILQVDETFFDSEGTEPMIQVNQCDMLVVCRSNFRGASFSQDGVISVNNATEHMIFENLIEGDNVRSVRLENSPMGNLQNNIFDRNEVAVTIQTSGDDYNLDCNFHEMNQTAWEITNGVSINQQGMENVPALNKFVDSEVHVSNDVNFNYLYDPLNSVAIQQIRAISVDLFQEIADFTSNPTLDICLDEDEIIGEWDTWSGCDGDFPYEWDAITCGHTCSCCSEPNIPIYIDDLVKVEGMILNDDLRSIATMSLEDEVVNSELLLNDNNSSTKSEYRIYPNPINQYLNIDVSDKGLSRLIIFDDLGRRVFEKKLAKVFNKLNLDELISGQYYLHLTLPSGKIITQQLIKI